MTDLKFPAYQAPIPVGGAIDWPSISTVPELWLPGAGQSLLRATYPTLFNAYNQRAICSSTLISNASPAVVSPGFLGEQSYVGSPVFFTTTGALPTGITADTIYYIKAFAGSTFTLGTARSINVITGAVTVTGTVNTSSAGSGTHCLWFSPYEIADSTHFYVPDFRGRVVVAKDDLGGVPAGVITWSNVTGLRAGEQTHTSLSTESGVPAHTHPSLLRVVVAPIGGGNLGAAGSYNETTVPITANTPADAASGHNTMQPSITMRKIIFAGRPSVN